MNSNSAYDDLIISCAYCGDLRALNNNYRNKPKCKIRLKSRWCIRVYLRTDRGGAPLVGLGGGGEMHDDAGVVDHDAVAARELEALVPLARLKCLPVRLLKHKEATCCQQPSLRNASL